MSRSGYSEDSEDFDYAELYVAAVQRAIKGRRGQAFLRELAAALDAMPDKILISGELINQRGECCTIGVVCKARAIDVSRIDCEDPYVVAGAIGVARSMAAEIAYENDECASPSELPSERWKRIRKWVNDNLEQAVEAEVVFR